MPSDTASAPDGGFPAGRDYGATLWAPGAATIERARITHYARWLAAERNVLTEGYEQLWQWSVDEPGQFWASIWDYFGVLGVRGDGPWLSGGATAGGTWFPASPGSYAPHMRRLPH